MTGDDDGECIEGAGLQINMQMSNVEKLKICMNFFLQRIIN